MYNHGKLLFSLMVVVLAAMLISGCASRNQQVLDKSLTKPQVVANPARIPLGVANLMDFKMIVEGSGFKPGDTVLISLVGQKDVDVSLLVAKVQPNGTFRAELGDSMEARLAKVLGILRATTRMTEDMRPVIVLTKPPIPSGSYRLKATGLLAALTAETPVEVVRPSIGGRIKDSLGRMLGRIEDNR